MDLTPEYESHLTDAEAERLYDGGFATPEEARDALKELDSIFSVHWTVKLERKIQRLKRLVTNGRNKIWE